MNRCYQCNKEFNYRFGKNREPVHKHINIYNIPKRKIFCSNECKLEWIYQTIKKRELYVVDIKNE